MRSHPPSQQPTTAKDDIALLVIPHTSTLAITLTVESNCIPRRFTKYRAVQRPDGVVTEYPRYRPEPWAPNCSPDIRFEKQLVVLDLPKKTTSSSGKIRVRSGRKQAQRRTEMEVRGVGDFTSDVEVEVGPLSDYGRERGGYNVPLEGLGVQGQDAENTPMERIEMEVRGVGSFTSEVELLRQCGRGGYNAPFKGLGVRAQRDANVVKTTMERFLGEEEGSWTAYSV